MQTFATTAAVSTVLDIPAGRIRLVAADRSDATVEVRPADASRSRDVKAAEETTVEFRDGVLRIAAAPGGSRIMGNSGHVEVTVQLPAGSHVTATVAAAEFRTAGPLGEVVLEGAQAEVKVEEAASARVTVQAGDVVLGRLNGPAEIGTQKGDITIAEAAKGELTLTTQHGAITVGAARGVSATLDAGTGYGRIHNALNNTDGPAAALTIRATTSYGDITARSI
ncbi:hypothetical protein BX286_3494 [Streptomyces sp. 3211.6]|uniref:DUF4097 family beta strand repeat-containing protein n=1 Tax=Streptomyces sp. 3211.6 TaxID=1938845 RepID=UPI000EAE3175|nr:DUF4097 family beta strand repeat-containing protein [Streptomyces sp. 3211.6]RKT05496.1 hypothetical protein BX286_3494 [Streptomyces sp. 3211.6]